MLKRTNVNGKAWNNVYHVYLYIPYECIQARTHAHTRTHTQTQIYTQTHTHTYTKPIHIQREGGGEKHIENYSKESLHTREYSRKLKQ